MTDKTERDLYKTSQEVFPDAWHERIADTDSAILKERATQYGSAKESFTRIAKLWSAYTGYEITAVQVAQMMVLLKINRSITAKDETLKDSFIDARNYLTLAEELSEADNNKQ